MRRGWASVAGMAAFVLLLHAVGWGLLLVVVAVVFVATWLIALAVWRLGHIDQRWSTTASSR